MRSIAVLALLLAPASATWDITTANTSLWFSAAAYCETSDYATRDWVGLTETFTFTKLLHHAKSDTNGFVGYQTSTRAIWVVFRGTTSLRNWIIDLEFALCDYTYPLCEGCSVHGGFYKAEQTIIADVIDEVQRLRALYSSYSVMVTGHSLGAALAQLTAMDLINNDIPVTLYHFGCPRVGNDAFSEYSNKIIPDNYRVVHDNDIVPHVPLAGMGFKHVCTEYFEDSSSAIHICDNSCEDPKCSKQYCMYSTSVDAHLEYLGQPISQCSYVS